LPDVELVREVIAANRSDGLPVRMAAMLAVWHPECEFVSVLSGVEPQTYRGRDGLRRYLADVETAWADWRADCEEAFEVAPGTVFASTRWRGTGKQSGAPVELLHGGIFVVSEGMISKAHLYPSRDEARRALADLDLTRKAKAS
jgi:ketosteroid isomerase-like protein